MVFLLAMVIFTQLIASGLTYMQNRQVSYQASQLIDNLVLSTGTPSNWGQSLLQPQAFGLQSPGYSSNYLTPFGPIRLLPAGAQVNGTGGPFTDLNLGQGAALLFPTRGILSYSTLLQRTGLSGVYQFSLSMRPALTLKLTQTAANPVTFSATVSGQGGPAYSARIKAQLYFVPRGSLTPSISSLYGEALTDTMGVASLSFPLDVTQNSYSLIASASLGGLVTSGFASNLVNSTIMLKPSIIDYAKGTVALLHHCDLNINNFNCSASSYNSTLLVPTPDNTLSQIILPNSTGTLTQGLPAYMTLPTNNPGILLTSFSGMSSSGRVSGIILMPWGFNMLGLSTTLGGTPASGQTVGVATRIVLIGTIGYFLTLTLWRG